MEDKSIPELEAELGKIEKKAKKSKEDSAKINDLKSRIKAEQKETKQVVMKLEETNFSHLIFYQSTKGFRLLAGNSVILFVGRVIPHAKWQYNRKPDTDIENRSSFGVIPFKNESFDKLTEQLKRAGLTKNEEMTNYQYEVWDLWTPASKKEFSRLADKILHAEKELDKVLMPSHPLPELYRKIEQLNLIIFHTFNKKQVANQPMKKYLGEKVFEITGGMQRAYVGYARSGHDLGTMKNEDQIRLEIAKQVFGDARLLKTYFAEITSLDVMEFSKITAAVTLTDAIITNCRHIIAKNAGQDYGLPKNAKREE